MWGETTGGRSLFPSDGPGLRLLRAFRFCLGIIRNSFAILVKPSFTASKRTVQLAQGLISSGEVSYPPNSIFLQIPGRIALADSHTRPKHHAMATTAAIKVSSASKLTQAA